MAIELVTGYAGAAHVTSAQDGRLNAAVFGASRYVLPTQNRFACTVNSANSVTIGTGDAMMDGRHVTSETPTSLAVDSGTQGMKRIDVVAVVYTKASTGVESVELRVYKGAETTGTPKAPTLPSGSILDGASTAAMALWQLPVTGITLGKPKSVHETLGTIADDANATYEIGYSDGTRTLTLTGEGEGASSTSAVLPLAGASVDGLLSAALFARLDGTKDWITQVGTNSGTSAAMQWRWIKLASGYAVAWGYRTYSLTATTKWGSLYYSTAIGTNNAPFTWAAAPYEWANLVADGYFWLVSHVGPTTAKTGSYYNVTASSVASKKSSYLEILQIGRWK